MEEPLFAQETEIEVKKEEPWDDLLQVKEEIIGDYCEMDPAPSPEVKPTIDPKGTLPSGEVPSREPTSTRWNPYSLMFPKLSFRWKCPVVECGRSFPLVRQLSDHMIEHPGRLAFKCSKCPWEFRTNSQLQQHLEFNHTRAAKLTQSSCSTCGNVFESTAELLKHWEQFGGRFHFFCKHCNTCLEGLFADHLKSGFHQLNAHRESVRAPKRPFPGEGDGAVEYESWPSRQGLPFKKSIPQWEGATGAQHAEDIMRQADPLVMTEEDISEQEEVKPPVLEEPELKPFMGTLPFSFKCPKCREGFHVFHALYCHMNKNHPGMPPLWCHLCPNFYRHENHFWLHMSRCHGMVKPRDHPAGYACDECEGHFRLRWQYAQHCQFLRGKPHTYCSPCSKGVLKAEWGRHIAQKEHKCLRKYESTSNPDEFMCLECGKLCSDREDYEEHRESLKKKPHAFCEPCGLVLDADFWEHHHQMSIGNHKEVKVQLYCCGETFRPEEWEEHQLMKSHRDSTWIDTHPLVWKCPVKKCGCAYNTWSSLVKHMSVHPGVSPFPCRKCRQRFLSRPARYDHEEREHSQDL